LSKLVKRKVWTGSSMHATRDGKGS
jgi:hypothetical protein